MKSVGIYIRVSTEEQARIQDGSLVSQRNRLEEYVEGQNRREAGWGKIVGVYVDEGRSGKDMRRSEFQRLLQDIKTGKVNVIMATELSRLSRSIKDFCELWEMFKKYGTSLITLRENFDTTNAAGELMVFNMINFSQFERKQTAERISANWASRAKRGLWNGGTIPLGYDRNPKNPGELLPSPTESKQVKEIFELFLKVGSVRKTCLEMSKKGCFSKHYTNKHGIEKGGGHMTVMSLQRILTNRAYIGLREIGIKSGKVEVVKANWPAIVDLELFNRVQDRLALNKNKYKPDEWKRYAYPLTEMVICGECGKHMGGKSAHGKNAKHYYYAHPRQLHTDGINHLKKCRLERVRAPRTEEMVLRSLKKLVSDPKLLDHWLEIYARGTQTELPAVEGRLKSLEIEIQTQTRREQNLVTRLADLPSDVSADPIYKQLQAIADKRKELEQTRDSQKVQQRQMTIQAVDRDALIFRIRRTIQNLEKAPAENQRPVFANLIKFAELHPTKVRLGVYAPTAALAATGTSDFRGSSTTVLNGAEDENRTHTPR